jgi:glycoside/pentoside/hexuronide:cation symporter, GPH family
MKSPVDLPEAKMASAAQSNPPEQRLSLKTKLSYGLGNVAVMVGKQAPKQLSLPIYNVTLGVNAGYVGTVLALGRLVDAFTDPFVGHLSDGLATRWGRRRPFILLGAIFAGLFFTALWLCPRGLTPAGYLTWFIAASLLYYMMLSLFCVPWYALGYELAPNYDERTRLMAFPSILGPVGQILVSWLFPLTQLPIFTDTMHGIRWVGTGAGLVIVVFGLIPAFFLKERFGSVSTSAGKKKPRQSLLTGVKSAVKNGPFVRLTLAVTTVLIGASMVGGLGFYVFVYYLYGGDKTAGSVLLGWHMTIQLAANMVLAPFLAKLSVRFGKKEVFLAAIGWGCVRSALLWFLLDPAHPWLVLINAVLMGVDNVAIFMLCHAMIADVCDVDERDHGNRREGLFGSLFSWVFKNGIALSYALSGFILVWIGYNPTKGAAQLPRTMELMKTFYSAVPAVFFLLAFWVFFKYPISRRLATEVRAELDERRRAATAKEAGA